MISPDGEARTNLTVVLPTSMPQIIAPFVLGASFCGVLISITPGSRRRGAIWTKLASAIEGPLIGSVQYRRYGATGQTPKSQIGRPPRGMLQKPHSQEWLCYKVARCSA